MKFIETQIKKLVYKAIIGELNIKNESLANQNSQVEDADFEGRSDSYISSKERVLKYWGK